MRRAALSILTLLALLLTTSVLAQPLGPEQVCAPGQLVPVAGDGAPPRAALLLSWGGRIVGGGLARADGRYTLTLAVGRERPGSYDVAVVTRSEREVLQRFRCVVPGAGAPVPSSPQATLTAPAARPTAGPPPTPPPPLLTPTVVGDRVTPAWWPCEEGQIKGSQTNIYHRPDQRDYDRTYVDVTCFDTAEEAETAGFRAAQQ